MIRKIPKDNGLCSDETSFIHGIHVHIKPTDPSALETCGETGPHFWPNKEAEDPDFQDHVL